MIEHDYITLKLVNGDTIICLLVGIDEEYFTIMYPMVMKAVRIETDGKPKEIFVGSPWNSFTDENVFNIYKQDVINLSEMNESTISYYKNMVDLSEVEDVDIDDYSSDIEDVNEISEDVFFIPSNNTIN